MAGVAMMFQMGRARQPGKAGANPIFVDADTRGGQMIGMDQLQEDDLKQLGLSVGRAVAGHDAVEQVEVETILDSQDRAAYYFSFLINQDRVTERLGMVRIRLGQQLREQLLARGDEQRPQLRLLDHTGWARFYHA